MLLPTKLFLPRLHPGFIARSHLITQLNNGLEGRLTLLSAPAGFGKSTLLAEWVHQAGQNGLSHRAWLTLDEQENDLTQFLTYLVAALQQAAPAVGQSALPRLQSAEPVSAETTLTLVIADLSRLDGKCGLFLDDYHLISNPAVHTALAFLLEHAPPQLHLTIAGRNDPPLALSRWRVRGEMQELRAADLRFTPAEAATFLHQALGRSLDADTIKFLMERTEGWPAGLQLVALSLSGLDETAAAGFITSFGGTHRHIFQYLVEEVWQRQTTEVQQFLLHSAVLDRLHAPLCAAVTGCEPEAPANGAGYETLRAAQENLDYLAANNLFLVPLDDAGQWFRYHHLFAEALLARLQETQPALIAELHRRAGRWYAAHGYTHQAIHHALAALDLEMSAAYIEAAADRLWPLGHLSILLSWFSALPGEIYRTHLSLCLLHAWLLFLHDRWEEAAAHVQMAGEQLAAGAVEGDEADTRTRQNRGRWAAIQGAMAAHRQESAEALAWMGMALEYLPATDIHWRQIAMIGLGLAQLAAGQAGEAITTFHQAALDCEQAQDLYLAFAAWWHQLEACWAQGRLHGVADCLHRLEMLAGRDTGNRLALAANAAVGWGMLAYEQNDLDRARELVSATLPEIWPGGQPRVVLQAYLALARLAQAQGLSAARQQYLEAANQLVEQYNLTAERLVVASTAARLHLAQGELAEARWQCDLLGFNQDAPADYRHEMGWLTLARLFLAERRPDDALEILNRLLSPATLAGREGSLLEIHLLFALALAQKQRPEQALDSLHEALKLAEKEQFCRIFINEGRPLAQLLAQITPRTPYIVHLLSQMEAVPAGLLMLDPLTDREIEILNLVAGGATNQDVADRLFISVGTVKGHINHILGKMDARNRTEAVALGRQMGLLKI